MTIRSAILMVSCCCVAKEISNTNSGQNAMARKGSTNMARCVKEIEKADFKAAHVHRVISYVFAAGNTQCCILSYPH